MQPQPDPPRHTARSNVGIPLVIGGAILGVIVLMMAASGSFSATPRLMPTATADIACPIRRNSLLDYQRTAGAPKLWEQLTTLQGGNVDGNLVMINETVDANGRCNYYWTGTVHGRGGPQMRLTWWYIPATGEIQPVGADTKQALGW